MVYMNEIPGAHVVKKSACFRLFANPAEAFSMCIFKAVGAVIMGCNFDKEADLSTEKSGKRPHEKV